MCYGYGCPFEYGIGAGPMAGECNKPKGAPCPSNYEDQAEFDFVFGAWERGDSVEQAEKEWDELEAQRELEEEEDEED